MCAAHWPPASRRPGPTRSSTRWRACADLVRARDAAVRGAQDAKTALAALEQSADVAALDARRETLIAHLDGIVHQWRRARLAQALLASTLDRYVQEHQPRVLAQASRLFATVTGGRYERSCVRATAASSRSSSATVLPSPPSTSAGHGPSSSTSACASVLRPSSPSAAPLAAHHGRRAGGLRPPRAKAVAAVLADFSRDRQVIAVHVSPGDPRPHRRRRRRPGHGRRAAGAGLLAPAQALHPSKRSPS